MGFHILRPFDDELEMNWNLGYQEMGDAKVCATFTLVDSGFGRRGPDFPPPPPPFPGGHAILASG
jgi:hypothetical protein